MTDHENDTGNESVSYENEDQEMTDIKRVIGDEHFSYSKNTKE